MNEIIQDRQKIYSLFNIYKLLLYFVVCGPGINVAFPKSLVNIYGLEFGDSETGWCDATRREMRSRIKTLPEPSKIHRSREKRKRDEPRLLTIFHIPQKKTNKRKKNNISNSKNHENQFLLHLCPW